MNSARTIADCLAALRAQTVPAERFEVIVVDDGSTDATAEIAQDHGARVLRITNSGPAVARNRGVAVASGSILVFTDADCAPDPAWLVEMLAPFADERVVATKGVYRSEQRSWTARFVQAEYESRYRRMLRRETIDFVDTYAAAYRRDAFDAAGGFDESFPLPSVEDQELSFRLAAGGARMVFCPRAVVAHRHASSPLAYLRKKAKIAYWKLRVLARFPRQARADSHTPASLKVELLLVAGLVVTLPLVVIPGWRWMPLGLLLGFAATIAPFCARVARKDLALALVSPAFLFGRALALGAGTLQGMVCGQFRVTVPSRARRLPASERARAERMTETV